MASVSRIRKVPGAAAAATAAEKVRGGRTAPPAPAEIPGTGKQNLDDPDTQGKILDPEPLQSTIGGQPIQLHPLPAKTARQFTGFYAQVFTASMSRRDTGTSLVIRFGGTIGEEAVMMEKLIAYAARSTFPTNDPPTNEELIAECARIDAEIQFGEIAILFLKLCEINHTLEDFRVGPKPMSPPSAPSST